MSIIVKNNIRWELLILLFCLPGELKSQSFLLSRESDKMSGIKWYEGSIWEQILKKAKSEQKEIFIDCFATWCAPCYKMDKEVFSVDSIINAVNKNYISIKLQMDTSKSDGLLTKKKYGLASEIKARFNVSSLPTYLFIGSNDSALHRVQGFKSAKEFTLEIANSTNENDQFYSQLRLYNKKKLAYDKIPLLVKNLRDFGDKKQADKLARDYIEVYLSTLKEDSYLKKEVLLFLKSNIKLVHSTDRLIIYCKTNPHLIDSISEYKGYSKAAINIMANRMEITPIASSLTEPNWDSVAEQIRAKYGQKFVEDNILNAKVKWYFTNKKYPQYTKYLIIQGNNSLPDKIDPNDVMTGAVLNNRAWRIFQYSTDKSELEAAIKWVDILLDMNPDDFGVLDTKANLLYKAGKTQEAIQLQEMALRKALHQYNNEKNSATDEIEHTLQNMKSGVPTWGSK